MTILPLKIRYSLQHEEYRIEDAAGIVEAGGYREKNEAEEDMRGLLRFYENHPTYLELPQTTGECKMNDSSTVVQVTKAEAVEMFVALGMKTASTWTKQRMGEKLSKLAEAHEADYKIEGNDAAQATFEKVYAAIKDGAGIELVKGEGVEEDTTTADNGEDKTPKASKTPKAPKEPKTPKPPKEYEVSYSQLDAAFIVLKRAAKTDKHSLDCDAIVTASEEFWKSETGKTPGATLASSLIREIGTKGEGSRFKKVGPNLFEVNF